MAEGEWQRVCAELEQRRGTFVIRLARSRLRVAITTHEEAENERGGSEEGKRREGAGGRGGRAVKESASGSTCGNNSVATARN